jgi:hypothetical protein
VSYTCHKGFFFFISFPGNFKGTSIFFYTVTLR